MRRSVTDEKILIYLCPRLGKYHDGTLKVLSVASTLFSDFNVELHICQFLTSDIFRLAFKLLQTTYCSTIPPEDGRCHLPIRVHMLCRLWLTYTRTRFMDNAALHNAVSPLETWRGDDLNLHYLVNKRCCLLHVQCHPILGPM
jgi:hypothetical protein